jgi:hypothetical protein
VALVPFFLFGAYENAYGHMLDRVVHNLHFLSESDVPPPARSQIPPQPSVPR